MKHRPLLLGIMAWLSAAPALAQENNAGLHVIRPILHADQERAELCLEFDHALDTTGGTQRITSALRLEMEGKPVALTSRNLTLAGNQLCVVSLEHRKNYRLSLAALRDGKNEKLSHPYSLALTIPPRPPAVSIVTKEARDARQNGIILWRDTPVLHSTNTAKIKMELYRITDPVRLAEAWNQRLQTALAPTESLYFARNNGTLVWKNDIKPQAVPDRLVETKLDFGSQEALTPGLYLIAATDADERPKPPRNKDETEKTKENKDKDVGLPSTSAVWLLRTDLNMQAVRDDKSWTSIVETAAATAPRPDIRVLAFDRNQQIIAEARSDANGLARLTPKSDKNAETQMLLAISDKGDVAFLDPARALPNPVLPPLMAALALDQASYQPAENINITLTARDLHRRAKPLAGSTLQLLRPDHSLYDSQPVTLDASGIAHLIFPAPATDGLWRLIWRQSNGAELAQTPVRVSANLTAPEMSLTADRSLLANDGGVNLTIRSQNAARQPAPYIAGHVELTWAKQNTPSNVGKDYTFDDGKSVDGAAKQLGSFLTDANGNANLHVTLPPADKAPALRQAKFRLVTDPSQGALDPDPVVIPVKPASAIVGIRPRTGKGNFPENSVAKFDVIALDTEGQRRAMDDLTYQIYEEGRSFEWFQSEGQWDYKPQQQRRRIGGGTLSIADNVPGIIEGPVTSGNYQLEITNTDGVLLARKSFNAGWGYQTVAETGVQEREKQEAAALDLKTVTTGKQRKLFFTLAHPAMVTIVMADDHLRSITHAAYPAGPNSININPAPDWGSRFMAHVTVRYGTPENNVMEVNGQILLTDGNEPPPVLPRPVARPATLAKPVTVASTNQALKETLRRSLPQQQSWKDTDAKSRPNGVQALAFVASEPIYDTPALLDRLLDQDPFATQDIARQLETIHRWRDAIIPALLPETEFRARQNDALMRLLARQKTDGGFAPLPGGESDIASTAAALETLVLLNNAVTRPPVAQAANWLRHRLENTWFNEAERPERAAAFAALAAAGKMDNAALHYYSDTTAEKQVPPLAAAQLAYAFAAINDKPASGFWIDRARGTDALKTLTADTLPVLFANEYYAPGVVRSLLEKSSKRALAAPRDTAAVTDFLRAQAHFLNRAGTWRLEIGKETKTLRGLLGYIVPEKNPATLRNPSKERALNLVVMNASRATYSKNLAQRRIYTLEGGEVTSKLNPGTVYVVMLEGAWLNDAKTALVVNDHPQPSFVPLTCAVEAPAHENFLGWLARKNLTPVTACEKTMAGLAILLPRSESNQWRIAYLAKATGAEARTMRPVTLQPYTLPNPDDKDARH